jgi:alkylhydroperoxidase family enzyme
MEAAWSLVRETLIVNGKIDRITKEAIAGAVSTSNKCPFCVAAHIEMSGGKVITGREQLSKWSTSHYTPNAPIILDPPFSNDEAPEIIGTAMAFHYINRMVSVFLIDFPLPLPEFLAWMKPHITAFFNLAAAGNITKVVAKPGTSLDWVSGDLRKAKFTWAEPNTHILKCFNGFDKLIGEIEVKGNGDSAMEAASKYIEQWNGEFPDLGNQWLVSAIESLSEKNLVLAQFILLVALQTNKISEELISTLKKYQLTDKELLTYAAWGAWKAARKIGERIGRPFASQ